MKETKTSDYFELKMSVLTAAFCNRLGRRDSDCEAFELANILRNTANKIEVKKRMSDDKIYDSDGRIVGSWAKRNDETSTTGEQAVGTFELRMNLLTPAFCDRTGRRNGECEAQEIANILRYVSNAVEGERDLMEDHVVDSDGKDVGMWIRR